MKKLKTFIRATLLMLLLVACSKDILEEQPTAIFEPGYFQTEEGVEGGLTALYAHLRRIYGNADLFMYAESGTDEATYADSGTGTFQTLDLTGLGGVISATNGAPGSIWDNTFPFINTASGIIENAAAVGISESLVSEARFFRAFDYFLLVQTFGGVPLDLGAGELKFNTSPARGSVRNTVPEVYTKAIFPDLITAVNELPDAPRLTGTVTKTVARLYLAKAYLTYAWWLENPNNIPTYPEASRTDPDGHDAQWYYQQAYDIAMDGINNGASGGYALLDTFYDVHRGDNPYNSEAMLFADHTESSPLYNGADLTGFNGNSPNSNWAYYYMTWNYPAITSSKSSSAWDSFNSVRRESVQSLGRPWTRMAPTQGVIKNTFNNKAIDSRFDGTFTTGYYGNWDKDPIAHEGPVYNANLLEITLEDPVLTFLGDEPVTPIDYEFPGNSSVGGGTLPGRSDFVIGPDGINRITYPGIWKLGPYRTDNGNGLGEPNVGSTRPAVIAKFSELYFIAAEAAVQGASGSMSARDLINVIRERAGKWKYDNANRQERVEDNSAAMIAATPAVIDIDYILEERSREYFGESYRWYDLVRTQKWEEIAGSYEIAPAGSHDPETFTRTIEPHHYLRPIPQGQIDGMIGTDAELDAYQNPGYE